MSLSPKKHLGQHFLQDQQYARRIAGWVPDEPRLPVLEIGPGEGVLTQLLLARFGALKAVELDPAAVEHLRNRFREEDFELIFQDVLKWQPANYLSGPTHFVGNLPYNISSPIFFHLLDNREFVASGVFMLQKEVAERICAGPGSKVYGILSVLLGAYFELQYGFTVPPGAFRPPPKVQSGVIRILPRKEVPDVDFPILKRLVKQAFNQRRKTLKNALQGAEGVSFAPDDPRWALRAEQLSVKDFVEMASR